MLKIDVSTICFIFVTIATIPVIALRTKTYSIGYEIGKLKNQEIQLNQKKAELNSELALIQKKIKDKFASKKNQYVLEFPKAQSVWREETFENTNIQINTENIKEKK